MGRGGCRALSHFPQSKAGPLVWRWSQQALWLSTSHKTPGPRFLPAWQLVQREEPSAGRGEWRGGGEGGVRGEEGSLPSALSWGVSPSLL